MDVDILLNILKITTQKFLHFMKRKCSKKDVGLCVLYHSKQFLVVNKRHDLLINTNNNNVKETLQTQLMKYCPSDANNKLAHKFHFVHRLDFVTSGVLCVALNREAARAAGDSFTTRGAKKYYVALVRGWVNGQHLNIQLAIGEDSQELEDSKRMCVELHPNCINPRDAQTRVQVLQRGLYDGYPATKVLLKPMTGRRHQLRVHLSYIGHTIVGDYTYSHRRDVTPPRTFLHSLRLVLPNALEALDVCTADPFASVPKWKPIDSIHDINSAYEYLDDKFYPGVVLVYEIGSQN